MQRFSLLWITLIFLAGCGTTPHLPATISGSLINGDGIKLMLLEMTTREMIRKDSAVLTQEGRFRFSMTPSESGFWLLRAPDGKVLVMVIHPGDQIRLTGSMNDFPNHIQLEGPAEARALHRFYQETRKEEQLVDSIEYALEIYQEEDNFFEITRHADTLLQSVWERQRRRELDYLTAHPGELSSLVVINYAFGPEPVLNLKEDRPWFVKLDSALTLRFTGNSHVVFHHQRLTVSEEMEKAPGNQSLD